jgi:hypothetical protein
LLHVGDQMRLWRYRTGKVDVEDATLPPRRMDSGTGDIAYSKYWTS